MDRTTIEDAIRALAADRELLERFKAQPAEVGATLGVVPDVAAAIARGDRGFLRAQGVDSGITILVGRWFGDSAEDTTTGTGFTIDETRPVPDPDVPTSLVFAGGCSHVPDLLARPEIDPPDQVDRLKQGYARLADHLRQTRPEVLIVTADNHFQSFRTGGLVVGTGARHVGSMAYFKRPDLTLDIAGDPAFASAAVRTVREAGLEVEASGRVDLDHGLIVPLRQVMSGLDIPVVPILTQPAKAFSPFGARAAGAALRAAVERCDRRVGILATGGLSHWLDPGKFGSVDVEFDGYILAMLERGRGHELGDIEPYPLLSHGQYEFPNWLIMLGMVGPGVRAEVYAYEPMEASGGGWTVVKMLLPQAVAPDG